MPTMKKTPVHLEIVVQVEGKAILFLFLNQKSYNTLTEGDGMYGLTILVVFHFRRNLFR